ncbi:hypothetical protein [Clostridium taeniosporum]|uniref:Uncharacterized protein n=1 Tax=Clostridium taeniosporum TaxID=394958 RepID=A0A1D7XMY3_9CLOT|nr:hypothetical protein [Clostridium taeniosporum]AOR24479.1 hypothetical protein BGI42_12360 [Clostridium taeniosporum]
MKYVNFILLATFLAFSTMYIYNIFILKSAGKENLKVSSLLMLFSIPIAIFILIVMSLFLNLTNWILPVYISNYKIFIISFVSIFTIFIGEFIIKIFLSNTVSSYFNKKYKSGNLSENKMMEIIRNKHNIIEIFKFILMFTISLAVYSVLFKILGIIRMIFIIILVSIVTSILYFFMFKSNKNLNK